MKNLFRIVAMLFISLALFYCKKDIKTDGFRLSFETQKNILAAKYFLDSTQEGLKIKSLSFTDDGNCVRSSINWDSAMFRKYDNHNYIEIPLTNKNKLLSDGVFERKMSIVFQFDQNGNMDTRIKQTLHTINTTSTDGKELGNTTIIVFDDIKFITRAAFIYSNKTKDFSPIYKVANKSIVNNSIQKATNSADNSKRVNTMYEICTNIISPTYSYQCVGDPSGGEL